MNKIKKILISIGFVKHPNIIHLGVNNGYVLTVNNTRYRFFIFGFILNFIEYGNDYTEEEWKKNKDGYDKCENYLKKYPTFANILRKKKIEKLLNTQC